MLRVIVLLLLMLNGLYFAWSQGLLRELGLGPAQQTEPQRLAQQIRPEALRLLTPQELRRLEAAVAKPPTSECLEAGLFDARQSTALRRALEEILPTGSWTMLESVQPGRWIVYMGKFASAEAAARKKVELKARGVAFEALRNPGLEPGISLGGYDTQANANLALQALTRQGVRTARVVVERPELRGELLRLPAVDEPLRSSLGRLKESLGARTLRACSK